MKYILLLFFLSLTLFSKELKITSEIRYFEQIDIAENIDITKQIFLPYNYKHSNFGFSKSIYWLKIDLKNSSQKLTKQVLHLPYTLLDYIDIYELKDDKIILQREYGDLRKYNNDGNIPDPSFIITLEKNQSKTFFYKVQTQGSMNLQLLIHQYEDFIDYSLEKSMVFSFYFGATFIMLLYNFTLYLFIRDRSYIYYLIFHINYLFFLLSFNGFSSAYIWPNFPFLNSYIVPFLMSIGSTLAVIFTIDFLHINNQSPKLFKLLKTLFWANVVMTLLVLFLSYYSASLLASFLSLISIIIILGSSIYLHFSSKNPYAKFFALAWGMLLMGIFIIHLRNLTLLSVNFFTSYSLFFGSFFELTLLSLALAYRYNIQGEELIEKNHILYKQSKLASMGEMLSNIAHQWRQPLNRVNLSLAVIDEVLKEENIDKEFINKKIESSEKNIAYMSQTIDDFANFFMPDKKKNLFNLFLVIEKALKLLESRLNDITIHLPKNRESEIYGFENEYIQIILVILNNAIDNFEITNCIKKDIFISILENNKETTLNICDNGGGIDKDTIEQIFNPYFTTKFKKEGTGIGLYMAKMLIENSMHGRLEVFSKDAQTTFIITNSKILQ
ncbi:MAG: sensor histidine kinase [Campylobacterota bacterium]|nr:sensor histidine kinase [Campylobacterota bacterium]